MYNFGRNDMKGLIRILLGMLIVIGVAGSDCDGKCMQDAMSLTDSVLWSLLGIAFLVWGTIDFLEYERN